MSKDCQIPLFLKALKDPVQFGWPLNPYLRIPAFAWIRLDPSPEAQRLAQEIWEGLPLEVQVRAQPFLEASPGDGIL